MAATVRRAKTNENRGEFTETLDIVDYLINVLEKLSLQLYFALHLYLSLVCNTGAKETVFNCGSVPIGVAFATSTLPAFVQLCWLS